MNYWREYAAMVAFFFFNFLWILITCG
uniref:Uncharacterized protein n=1 Tax=Rhizophora mucronata TaxID=61149 RepID=A0A2P2P3H5_RHIMU